MNNCCDLWTSRDHRGSERMWTKMRQDAGRSWCVSFCGKSEDPRTYPPFGYVQTTVVGRVQRPPNYFTTVLPRHQSVRASVPPQTSVGPFFVFYHSTYNDTANTFERKEYPVTKAPRPRPQLTISKEWPPTFSTYPTLVLLKFPEPPKVTATAAEETDCIWNYLFFKFFLIQWNDVL